LISRLSRDFEREQDHFADTRADSIRKANACASERPLEHFLGWQTANSARPPRGPWREYESRREMCAWLHRTPRCATNRRQAIDAAFR